MVDLFFVVKAIEPKLCRTASDSPDALLRLEKQIYSLKDLYIELDFTYRVHDRTRRPRFVNSNYPYTL